MIEYKGIRVGQKWEDTENGESDFEIIEIKKGGSDEWTANLNHGEPSGINIVYEQDGVREVADFNEFIDWAETCCYSPKEKGEKFWLEYFHQEENNE